MRPLRIAIVSETFLPQTNGVVTRLCQALRYLPEWGDTVLLLVPGEGGTAEHAGVRIRGVSAFPLPAYPDLPVALPRPTVNRELDQFWPDLVHAVNPALLGLNAVYHSRRHRVPLICSFHTHLPRYLRHYGLGPLEPVAWQVLRRVHAEADRNLCISRPMEAELRHHGFPRLRLGWRGGVDANRFHPGRRSDEMRRRLLGANRDGALLLYVGRLGAEKGIERLRALLDALPQARLALVGDGPHRPALHQAFQGAATTFVGRLAERSWRRPTHRRTSSPSPPTPRPSVWWCWRRWRLGSRSSPPAREGCPTWCARARMGCCCRPTTVRAGWTRSGA